MSFQHLPPLEVLDMTLETLRALDPDSSFRIPQLLDKPQNPILNTLRFWATQRKAQEPIRLQVGDDILDVNAVAIIQDRNATHGESRSRDIWSEAITKSLTKVCVCILLALHQLIGG